MSVHTDRIGEVHHELTVTGYDKGSYYLFKCSCGKDCRINYYDVRKGRTKSCGHIKESRKTPHLVGEVYNDLTAVKELGFNNKKQREYLFKCVCGKEVVRLMKEVRIGKLKSCGCGVVKAIKKANTSHGLSKSSIYQRHQSMLKRCYSSNHSHYHRYGGRGITVCDEWVGDDGFENFYRWAMKNGFSEELSIDRIDNNKGYIPSNCRWTDSLTQTNNRECTLNYEHNGITKPLTVWANDLDICYDSLWKRIKKYNYTFEDAITLNVDRISK